MPRCCFFSSNGYIRVETQKFPLVNRQLPVYIYRMQYSHSRSGLNSNGSSGSEARRYSTELSIVGIYYVIIIKWYSSTIHDHGKLFDSVNALRQSFRALYLRERSMRASTCLCVHDVTFKMAAQLTI